MHSSFTITTSCRGCSTYIYRLPLEFCTILFTISIITIYLSTYYPWFMGNAWAIVVLACVCTFLTGSTPSFPAFSDDAPFFSVLMHINLTTSFSSTHTNFGVQHHFRGVSRAFANRERQVGRHNFGDGGISGRCSEYIHHGILFSMLFQVWFTYRFVTDVDLLAIRFHSFHTNTMP